MLLKVNLKTDASKTPKIPENDEFVFELTNDFNDSIVFEPDQLRMAYTIRDPIINSDNKNEQKNSFKKLIIKNLFLFPLKKGIFNNETNRGFADK